MQDFAFLVLVQSSQELCSPLVDFHFSIIFVVFDY